MVIDPTSLAVNVFSGGNGRRVAGYCNKGPVAFDFYPKHTEARTSLWKVTLSTAPESCSRLLELAFLIVKIILHWGDC